MGRSVLAGIVLLGMALLSVPGSAYAKGWEPLKADTEKARRVASDTEIEIRTDRGMIYISTNRNLNIKIFTILGSQIANDNLAPGSYQFAVPAHGVYIIKAGDLTCKVAV